MEEETGLRSEVEKTSLNKEEVTQQEEINLDDPKNTIFITKRNGKQEPIDLEKIHKNRNLITHKIIFLRIIKTILGYVQLVNLTIMLQEIHVKCVVQIKENN